MKSKVIGAILAGASVGLLGWAMVTSYNYEGAKYQTSRLATYDIKEDRAPLAKFAFQEAVQAPA